MKTSLLTVSYKGDFVWLPFLLKSTAKYVSGFDEHVIAVPAQDKHLLDKFGLTKEKIVTVDESGFKCPFHAHQFWVMNADQLCTGDVVVNVDSDCIFTSPVTPETYIEDGKCVNLCTKYGPTCDSPWRPGTENMLQHPVEFEFMRRHGGCYPIELYSKLRKHVEDKHGNSMMDMIKPMGRAANLSEFNLLGAYGYYFMPERFKFIDTDKEPTPPNPIFQSWSHLIRIGRFEGNLLQHLQALTISAPPEYAKPAAVILEKLQQL